MTPTPAQQSIINAPARGERYVIAGPGAGKTTVIAQRTARLIAAGSYSTEQIAAITYTTAMARRLVTAITDALPDSIPCGSCSGTGVFNGTDLACGMCAEGKVEPGLPFVGTMHALAAWATGRALRGEIAGRGEVLALGWLPHGSDTFGIALPEDVDDMIDTARRAPGKKTTKKALKAGLRAAGRALDGWPKEVRARQELARRGLLTYDDLLVCLSVIVNARPTADEPRITDQIECLIIDEGQDLTADHWAIAGWGASITAVGDDGQEIFGFLGRDGQATAPTFRERVADPGAIVLSLGQSFRSGPSLVDPAARLRDVLAADGACSALPMVSAVDDSTRGLGFRVTRADDDDEGGIYSTARAVDELVFMGYEPHEIAVIARRWAEVETLAGVLEQMGHGVTMPHRSRDVWRSLAGRAFVAMVRHASTGFLDEHGAEVILRALGIMAPVRVAERAAHAALVRGETLAEALDRDRDAMQGAPDAGWWSGCAGVATMLDFAPYLGRHGLPGVRLIERAWSEAVEPFTPAEWATMTPAQWLLWLAGPDAQSGEATFESGKVALTSVHGAKGLEWPAVVAMGACAGHWPGHMDKGESGAAEAARALYVAITRAKETCRVISPALLRGKPREPSPWLVAAGLI